MAVERLEVSGKSLSMRLIASFVLMILIAASGKLAAQDISLRAGTTFSFEALAADAKRLASEPSRPPLQSPAWLSEIDDDVFASIAYKPEMALLQDAGSPFQVQLFHPGRFFQHPVEIFTIADGIVDEITFSPDYFEYGTDLAEDLSEIRGFAGFRLLYQLNQTEIFDEVIAFLGASYFRALGRGNVYGASARGLAIDTGTVDGEEFPVFTAFWLEKPRSATSFVIYALLESSSVVGAFRFEIVPGERTEVATQSRLFFRTAVERVGVAPLTSMFYFGPNDRVGTDDYRPRVHNSQALLLWRADDSVLWRPLANPQELHWTVLATEDPKAFGLIQRDRDFQTFQDLEARYDLRPSVWVEPIAPFGMGSVVMLELPASSEAQDNIVAFWSPEQVIEEGTEATFSYRVFWSAGGPSGPAIARVVDTRIGRRPIETEDDSPSTRRVVVDFSRLDLPLEQLKPVVSAWSAELGPPLLRYNALGDSYRLSFDVTPTDSPAEISAWLDAEGGRVSEIWIYRLDET